MLMKFSRDNVNTLKNDDIIGLWYFPGELEELFYTAFDPANQPVPLRLCHGASACLVSSLRAKNSLNRPRPQSSATQCLRQTPQVLCTSTSNLQTPSLSHQHGSTNAFRRAMDKRAAEMRESPSVRVFATFQQSPPSYFLPTTPASAVPAQYTGLQPPTYAQPLLATHAHLPSTVRSL